MRAKKRYLHFVQGKQSTDTYERLTCAMARKPYLTKDQACTASKILMSIFLQSQKTS